VASMTTHHTNQCPICSKTAEVRSINDLDTAYDVNCPRCGSFFITEPAISFIKDPQKTRELFKISAYLRERSIAQQPKVTVVELQQSTSNIKGAAVSVDDILTSLSPRIVSERLDRALKNIQQLSAYPGETIELFADNDYPIFFSENEEAFHFVRNTLQDAGLIRSDNTIGSSAITLTGHGWNRIAEIERERAGKDSRQAFVAMWFDHKLDKTYIDGFAKAIRSTGYEPLRVDLKEHNGKIDDAIIAEIRKSRFVVADFTGHRAGVYYEAGFAKGLGLEVIWTCHESDIGESHFDTRQYNHIVWKDDQDLFEKLRRRIEATIPA